MWMNLLLPAQLLSCVTVPTPNVLAKQDSGFPLLHTASSIILSINTFIQQYSCKRNKIQTLCEYCDNQFVFSLCAFTYQLKSQCFQGLWIIYYLLQVSSNCKKKTVWKKNIYRKSHSTWHQASRLNLLLNSTHILICKVPLNNLITL